MELNKRSVLVKRAVEEFETRAQRLGECDVDYQEAASIVLYVLDKYPAEKRHDRFFASMKLILRALDKFPKPSIGVVRQQAMWLCDALDDCGKELAAFNQRFR
jgi:hypothetical protein